MFNKGFSYQERLRKRRDFERIFEVGTAIKGKYLTIIQTPSPTEGTHNLCAPSPTRIGFVLSHKIKGSVIRNKLKRRLREIYRKNKSNFRGDYIILAHPGSESMSWAELNKEFLKLTTLNH